MRSHGRCANEGGGSGRKSATVLKLCHLWILGEETEAFGFQAGGFQPSFGAFDENGIDRNRVTKALEAANLSALIGELPEGIDSMVGDNGNRLSGGQRQRLAIARAIYKDAPILILDEATSALDSESERQVQDALERLMAGRTTLVIAHRLSTIEHASRIVVLEHGQIIENGSHEELIGKDGLYASLHRIQFSNS
jgi:subfamily B ATP-binding cassette protein MsbA